MPASAADAATARREAWVTAASSEAASPTDAGLAGADAPDRHGARQRRRRRTTRRRLEPRRARPPALDGAAHGACPGDRMSPTRRSSSAATVSGARQPSDAHASADSTSDWVSADTLSGRAERSPR